MTAEGPADGEVVNGEVVDDEQDQERDEQPAETTPPTSGTLAVYDGAPAAPVAQRAGMLDRATDSWVAVASDVIKLAGYIAPTEFVPQGMQGRPAVVAAAILHGRELGLAPMTALAGTHVIHGRVGLSSEAMRGLVLAAGHSLVYEETSSARCVVRGRRSGTEDWTRVEWTIADAQRAGLTSGKASKDRWAAYPRQMLAARATAELCRLLFADVIHGMSAVEEIDDASDAELPAVAASPAVATTTQVRRQPSARPPKESEPEKQDEPPQPVGRRKPALPSRGPGTTKTVDGGALIPEPSSTANVAGSGEAATGAAEEPSQDAAAPANSGSGDASTTPAPTLPDASDNNVQVDHNPEPLRMIKPGQRAAIMGHAKRLDFEDRDARLIVLATLAGIEHKLESANHLTELQAADILIQLERCRDRAALDKLLEQS